MWTPRKQKSVTVSPQSLLMIRGGGVCVFFLLESIMRSLVFDVLRSRLLSHHCAIIRELDDGVAAVGCGAVLSVDDTVDL